MKLKVLGSGSSGNCYILEGKSEFLVLEAGIPFKEVAHALGGNLRNVSACLVSHEHGDHAAHVGKFLQYSIPVYMSAGTAGSIQADGSSFLHLCSAGAQFCAGGFSILPFRTRHDAADPLGFLVMHDECGVVLFATDTYYLPCRFSGLNHIMIECNYIEDQLSGNVQSGELHPAVAKRVRRSHMELGTCIEALKSNDLSAVTDILLIHLSRSNGDQAEMTRRVVRATGRPTYAARKGLELDYSKF